MTRIDALRALKNAVEDEAVDGMTPHCDLPAIHVLGAYFGSLDAAKALHEALLPNHSWDIWRGIGPDCVKYYGCNIPGIDTVYVADPARAWLLAIIRALIAQECAP